MSHLDDLPKRDRNSQIQEQSETAFQTAISECDEFVVQSEDKKDYGTDYVIEARDAGVRTNVRVHVQLKGTRRKRNADGSISVSIDRTNLNYLLMQPYSIFVCCHTPSKQLLVRSADDVLREYEHSGKCWVNQNTVTVRFNDVFDHDFQRTLKEIAVVCAKGARDHRLYFATQPPVSISAFPEEGEIDLPVPTNREQAEEMLAELYNRGQDRTISRSFGKFCAILGPSNEKLTPAYMAEINLGINGRECNKTRIADGIEVILSAVDGGEYLPGSLLYCVGNGWFAIGEYERARDAYNSALALLDKADLPEISAQCCKNLGAALEKLGKLDAAHGLYSFALELDPNLAEAHFALALWYNRKNADLDRALEHLDAIVWPADSAGTLPSVQGWRAEILFKQGKTKEAFRDIHGLVSGKSREAWVSPWCARLVATYGRSSFDAAQRSVQFWDIYLKNFTDDVLAQRERLLCVYFIHANGGWTGYDHLGFKRTVADVVANGVPNPAFLWDRAGHWAQDEEDWSEAEKCYRKAYNLSPTKYGYCLGTALNFLGRYEEALPILLPQAKEHQPDALSWFQVAVARNETGDIEGCVNAYKRALRLDENYELAWFNLGGVYWNSKNEADAITTWQEAIRRFPQHRLSSKLQRDFPILRHSQT